MRAMVGNVLRRCLREMVEVRPRTRRCLLQSNRRHRPWHDGGLVALYAILATRPAIIAEGSFAARLEGVVFAVFVIAMIFFAIRTLQQRDLEKVRREVGEVWWRGPG